MQVIFSEIIFRLAQPEDVGFQVFIPFLWKMTGLGLLFFLLGLWLARLWFGSRDKRLAKARLETFQMLHQTNEIVDEQNSQIKKLKKTAAVNQADLNYRDTKIEKLTNDRVKMQSDLNEKIKAEMQFANTMTIRDLEIERLGREMEKFSKNLSEKDALILELRKDLAQKEGIYARLGELEAVIDERDREINQLREGGSISHEATAKINSLEQLLTNRDDELSRLRADRDKLRQDLEITLRNRESKIMELEDSLGERESMIVALEAELMDHHKSGKKFYDFENLIAERDLEIEELKKLGSTKGELQNELNKLRSDLHKRDSEIQNIKKQYHDAKQQRETKLHEAQTQIEAQNAELKSLRALQSAADKTRARLAELESQLDEKEKALHKVHTQRDNLEKLLDEKDRKLTSLDEQKTSQEGLVARIQELEWLLGEKVAENNRLNHHQTEVNERLKSQESFHHRIQELEHLLGEKSAELTQLALHKHEMGQILRLKESDLEAMRKDRLSYDTIQHRLSDLERVLVDRERELHYLKADRDEEILRLKRENADLMGQLRSSESELKRLRIDRISPENNYPRNGEIKIAKSSLRVEPIRMEPAPRVERDPADDILARLRELERMVSDRDRESRLPRPYDKSEYRFTLEDGTVTYLRASDTLEYEGKIHRAEDLYYLLRERDKG
jgi:chromosome segregation ATPase